MNDEDEATITDVDEYVRTTATRMSAELADEHQKIVQPAYDVLVPHLEADTHLELSVREAWEHFRGEYGADPELFSEIVGAYAQVAAEDYDRAENDEAPA